MVEVEDFEETLAARLRGWEREKLVSALVQAEVAKCGLTAISELEDEEDVARWKYLDYAHEELVEAAIQSIEDANEEEDGEVFIDETGEYRVALPKCPVSNAPCADYRESCGRDVCWVKA